MKNPGNQKIHRGNLHIHSLFSDGHYVPEKILQKAKENQLDYIGFSDHLISLKPSLISLSQFENYFKKIQELREQYQIPIYIGGEIDIHEYDQRYLPILENFDYLNFEYAQSFTDLKKIEKIRKKLNQPFFLVHTLFSPVKNLLRESFKISFKKFKKLADYMEQIQLGIELTDGRRNLFSEDQKNFYPFYNFYPEFFEEIRERLFYISVGTDMHDDLNELSNFNLAYDFIVSKGLIKNYQYTLSVLKQNGSK